MVVKVSGDKIKVLFLYLGQIKHSKSGVYYYLVILR